MNKQILIKNIKSRTFWISVGALILLLLHNFGVNVVDAQYNEILNSILTVLALAGILNSPQIEQPKTEDTVVK